MAFTQEEIDAADLYQELKNNPNGGNNEDYTEVCTILEDPANPGQPLWWRSGEDETAKDFEKHKIGIIHPRGTQVFASYGNLVFGTTQEVLGFGCIPLIPLSSMNFYTVKSFNVDLFTENALENTETGTLRDEATYAMSNEKSLQAIIHKPRVFCCTKQINFGAVAPRPDLPSAAIRVVVAREASKFVTIPFANANNVKCFPGYCGQIASVAIACSNASGSGNVSLTALTVGSASVLTGAVQLKNPGVIVLGSKFQKFQSLVHHDTCVSFSFSDTLSGNIYFTFV